jgi:uncharacterized protein
MHKDCILGSILLRNNNNQEFAVKKYIGALLSVIVFTAVCNAGDDEKQKINDDLILYAKVGKVIEVKSLLKKGANPNAAEEDGQTALMSASSAGDADVVEVLLKAGANPNLKSGDLELTALMYAAQSGDEEVVKLLLKAGADPNLAGSSPKITPLNFALHFNHPKIAELLKKAGAKD